VVDLGDEALRGFLVFKNAALTARCQHMGDTLMPTHRLHFCFLMSGPWMPVKSWTHSSGVSLMKMADQEFGKIDRPNSSPQTPEGYCLSDESFPHKTFAPGPTNLSIAANPPALIARPISQHGQPPRKPPPTLAIQLPRSSLTQCFVGSGSIVVLEPGRSPMLLPSPAPGSRAYGFPFQYSVKLFVGSVVLRMRWPRELHSYAQSRPPNAQSRKPRWTLRCEGSAIVHANDLRPSIRLKKPCKHSLNRPPMLGRKQPHYQPVTAEQIPHGQRFAPFSVSGAEPAFEIHRPNLIGASSHCQRPMLAHTGFGRTPTRCGHEVQSFEPPSYRSQTRCLAPAQLQLCSKLLGPPVRVLLAPKLDPVDTLPFQPTRHPLGPARAIAQRPLPALQETLLPFVYRLAADAENTAPISQRLFFLEQHQHQASSLPNNRSSVPRHDRRKPPVL
jgi:hypothetical protein